MKIVRKILVLTINTDWSNDITMLLRENPKVDVEVITTRTAATKLITENNYEVVIIEDSFSEKNIEYFFRVLSTQKQLPKFIYTCFSDYFLYQRINIPADLGTTTIKAYSLPMLKNTLVDLIYTDIFPLGFKNLSFDREFNQVLVRAATKVLETLEVSSIKVGKPELLTKMEPFEVSIRGKIIIKSDFFSGALFISFPVETYKKIYKKVLREDIENLSKENTDFAGEIANMVYGQAKKELSENGVNLSMAIPVLDQSAILKSDTPIYVIPLESSVGNIYIKIAPNLF